MKTIKNIETGEITRVEDKESYQRVGYGWTYVPKSEWKANRKTNVVVSDEPQPKQTKASKKNEKKSGKSK